MTTKKECSQIQEFNIANYLDWNVVSGSGSRPTSIGDVQSARMIGECKTHVKSGHKIEFKSDVWKKIKSEANARFKFPILFVDDGSQNITHTWCMTDVILDTDVVDYPNTYSKNILFSYDELDSNKVYRVKDFGSSRTVYIVHLVFLKSEFEGAIC